MTLSSPLLKPENCKKGIAQIVKVFFIAAAFILTLAPVEPLKAEVTYESFNVDIQNDFVVTPGK